MWIQREIENQLKRAVASRPAVLLTGVRQSGKTSLLQYLFPKADFVSLDNVAYAAEAEENPSAFLSRFEKQVVLDEIQYAPSLFRELKIRIDQERKLYGKWILTGSQRFNLMRGVSESLAGRVEIANLETLSAQEIRSEKKLDISDRTYLWKGGYPELWSNQQLSVSRYFESYIQSYLERDLRSILQVGDLRDYRRFLAACASRIGQLVVYSDLARDVGISPPTAKSWLSVLEASGLIYLLPPYYRNLGKRLIKSPKLYFSDHGLAAHLLGVEDNHAWQSSPLRGSIWENFVVMEYIKSRNLQPGRTIFFYRDQNGVEIDLLVESNKQVELIESKSSERVDEKKLNFKKVVPLFGKQQVSCVVACPISENLVRRQDFTLLNPLFARTILA